MRKVRGPLIAAAGLSILLGSVQALAHGDVDEPDRVHEHEAPSSGSQHAGCASCDVGSIAPGVVTPVWWVLAAIAMWRRTRGSML